MISKTHQIQTRCFSRHFYVVNFVLVLPQMHWTNFNETKILFIFHDSNFKVMTFSVWPEADQNISDRLLPTATDTQLATVHFMLSDGAKYSGIHFWKA